MKILILAGGDGTRLWPLSTQTRPKQFLAFPFGDQKHSLLCNTLIRALQKGHSLSDIFIATWVSYYDQILQELEAAGLNIPHKNIVCEPSKKNTAPAIALSAQYILENAGCDLQEVILILPSDQLIEKGEDFKNHLKTAETLAREGYIVTLGVPPTQAETGYGYIETYQEYAHQPWLKVKAFVEKPDRSTATQYLKSQRHLWNSGILAMTLGTLMNSLHQFEPELYNSVKNGYASAISHYSEMANKSFDYAVLEHATNIAVVPMRLTWSDLGSWDHIYDNSTKNTDGNAIHGNQPVCLRAENNLIWNGTGRQLALIGISDLIIVDTTDALLIAKQGNAQAIKSATAKIHQDNKKSPICKNIQKFKWGDLFRLNNSPPLNKTVSIFQIHLKPHKSIVLETSPQTHAMYIGKGSLMNLATGRTYNPGEQMALQNARSHVYSTLLEECHLIVIGEPPEIQDFKDEKVSNTVGSQKREYSQIKP